MSRENADAIRAVYERFGNGDFRASLDVVDPLVLLVMPPEFPDSGTYLGVESLARYTRGFLEPWTRITIEAEEITDAGDSVVVAVRQRGVGSESGAATELRYFQVWSFRGRKVIRLENFRERSEALEAVRSACQQEGEPLSSTTPDADLKARHRAMWASGDYPSMVETFLLPLGPRLVDACGLGLDMRVLDVAAGTGNASIPAAERGASVTASDLTPELLEAGRRRAEADGLELGWVEADAESLPFDDEAFDAVMSSIGAMFAPHHQPVADELVRVCRPGGTVGLLSWTPEGMIGALFRAMGPFAPPPPPGAQPPPLWGDEDHVRGLFGDRVAWETMERDVLEITAFERPSDYGTHFKERYGPTIAAQANARRNEREEEFVEALDRFCDEWNRGTADEARFEQEFLLSVGKRA